MYRHGTPITISALFLILCLICSFFPAALSPYPPDRVYDSPGRDLHDAFSAPSMLHPMGKDDLGRDILSRIIYGTRISLFIGFTVVLISLITGCLLGFIAGWLQGFWDELIMRLVDIFLAFPGILLAIGIIAVLGPGYEQTIIALCLTGWVGYARLTRGLMIQEKNRTYVLAAKSLGSSSTRIMVKHILPNILAPLIIKATFGLAGAIMAEASLSFLGLGIQPPIPSWGNMLHNGAKYLILPEASHLSIFPGLAIMLVIMALNRIGESLRDLFDPTMRHKSALEELKLA